MLPVLRILWKTWRVETTGLLIINALMRERLTALKDVTQGRAWIKLKVD